MNLPFCNIAPPDLSGVPPERAQAIISQANRRYAGTSLGVTAWRVAGIAELLVVALLTLLSQPIWLIVLIGLAIFFPIYLLLLILSIRSHQRAMVRFVE